MSTKYVVAVAMVLDNTLNMHTVTRNSAYDTLLYITDMYFGPSLTKPDSIAGIINLFRNNDMLLEYMEVNP